MIKRKGNHDLANRSKTKNKYEVILNNSLKKDICLLGRVTKACIEHFM